MRELVHCGQARPLSGLGELLTWVLGAATDDVFTEFCKLLPARDTRGGAERHERAIREASVRSVGDDDNDDDDSDGDVDDDDASSNQGDIAVGDRQPVRGSDSPSSGGDGGGDGEVGGPFHPCSVPSAPGGEKTVRLVSATGEAFLVPMTAAERMSEYVATMMKDAGAARMPRLCWLPRGRRSLPEQMERLLCGLLQRHSLRSRST
jgi:hypothetical protein